MNLQLKVGSRFGKQAFVYVGADDVYLCQDGFVRLVAVEMGLQ